MKYARFTIGCVTTMAAAFVLALCLSGPSTDDPEPDTIRAACRGAVAARVGTAVTWSYYAMDRTAPRWPVVRSADGWTVIADYRVRGQAEKWSRHRQPCFVTRQPSGRLKAVLTD